MRRVDHTLIGSGIMSTTLGVMLKKMNPETKIDLIEVSETLSPESSHGWNNAGTGHAGICELSYTPFRDEEGRVKVDKAIEIYAQFERSLQFWASAVEAGILKDPSSFLQPLPHISFVSGEDQVEFLRSRFEGLKSHHFFESMSLSEDRETIADWAPLLMKGRDPDEAVAATSMEGGTDVNFGAISRQFAKWLGQQDGVELRTGSRVVGLEKIRSGWEVVVRNGEGVENRHESGFVFVGAGGGSLPLLQDAKLPEAEGYGGFPVGGEWLVCDKPDIVAKHEAKVYGQPQGEAPTMAVPHLDTRTIDGKKALLFGPFAAWTTRYLVENGSWWDLPGSVRPDNLLSMIRVGMKDLPLVGYLVKEGLQRTEDRMELLRTFYPEAKEEDWHRRKAGIRVQAITKQDGETGIVHFGTEVLVSEDKSMAALLGASPGASVSVHVMTELIERCFGEFPEELLELIPALREDIAGDSETFVKRAASTRATLGMITD
ncbi:MAG: malate dehydrogenase (quinone) [Verrucomicrobiota bacterium]